MGKENASDTLPGQHIEAQEEVHDVITLNFYSIPILHIFITVMKWYIYYTSI